MRRGARTSGSSRLWGRCLSLSTFFRGSNMDRSKDGNCRQQNSSLFHRASLTKTKEATSGFQVGIPITNARKRAAVDRGDGSPRYGLNQRRGGMASPAVRSFRSKASHRPERGPVPNSLCACPAFINTSGGDANTGSDDDAGSGHTRKRGARNATRLAVWRRLAAGQNCRHSGAD